MSGDTSSHCRRCNASHDVTEMWTKPGRGYLCEKCTEPPPPESEELRKLRERFSYTHKAWTASSEDAGRLERENTVLILALRDSKLVDEAAVFQRDAERRAHDMWNGKHAEAIALATRTEDGDDEESR